MGLSVGEPMGQFHVTLATKNNVASEIVPPEVESELDQLKRAVSGSY